MIVLSTIERTERRYLRNDGRIPDSARIQFCDHLLGDALLLWGVVEDRRAVLRSDVRSLPVQRRGIVDGEEDLKKLSERNEMTVGSNVTWTTSA